MPFKFSFIKIAWVGGIVLLIVVLYFDFRVYKKFVLGIESQKNGDSENLFLLKTPLLEKAAEDIRKKDEFLENTNYPPLIKNPF